MLHKDVQGAGEVTRWGRARAALAEGQHLFPAPTWPLTTSATPVPGDLTPPF